MSRKSHQIPFDDLKKDRSRKLFLIHERGHQCECCKLTEWMSKKIPLQLDHIDGNADNKTKDNFRLLCPNCHAQTETYCGKNVGKFVTERQGYRKKFYKYGISVTEAQ